MVMMCHSHHCTHTHTAEPRARHDSVLRIVIIKVNYRFGKEYKFQIKTFTVAASSGDGGQAGRPQHFREASTPPHSPSKR